MHDDHRSLLAKRTQYRAAGTLQSLEFVSGDKSTLEASYRVVWRIAKEKKTHAIGERLIKPCVMAKLEFIFKKEQKKKISLSNDTVRRRISDMSQDILDQVAEKIRACKARVSLQLDKSTDVLNCVYLLVYYRICACW